MPALFAFTFLIVLGIVGGAYVIRPVIMKRLDKAPEPKLLGPSQEEYDDLADRLRRLEEVVLFDGDKAELADALKAAEERGKASANETIRLKELEIEKAKIEAKTRPERSVLEQLKTRPSS